MLFRRARIAAFLLLLGFFSANYFLWLYRTTTGQTAQDFYREHQIMGKLHFLSQFVRVYDTPNFFQLRQEVWLTYLNGQSARLPIERSANPLDDVAFSHIWYWLDENNPEVIARKERLLRARYCRPGVRQVEWKAQYLNQPVPVRLGNIGC